MTKHYELTKAFNKGGLVLICTPCLEEKKDFPLCALEDWLVWEPYRFKVEYKEYSHGYCPAHTKEALDKLGAPSGYLDNLIE